jgi:peptide/nickel transport system permease protein
LRQYGGRSRRAANEEIRAALAKLRIVDPARLLNSRPHQLSGGMRQRALIAGALATDAKLIIADEPTTALDVTVQADILREFKRLNRTLDSAMLFISHDISVVQVLCDRVLVMKNGEIVERATQSELRSGQVEHPYTRRLLDSVARLEWR